MKIYLIIGNSGEQSDHAEWNVAAYTTPEMAEEHVKRIEEMMKVETKDRRELRKVEEKLKESLDPKAYLSYTGAEYGILEIEVFRHLDEFLEEEKS